jgi:hypothetical protein
LSDKTKTIITSGDMNILLHGNQEQLEKLVIAFAKGGGEFLERGVQHFAGIAVIKALCYHLAIQFMLSNQIFMRILQQISAKIRGDIRPSLTILSFLTQKDETFKELACPYRFWCYKIDKVTKKIEYVSHKDVKSASTSRGRCFSNYAFRFPIDPRNKFLHSELSIVEKYKRLFLQLKSSIGRYPTKKDNEYVCRIVEECRKFGAFIHSFCNE